LLSGRQNNEKIWEQENQMKKILFCILCTCLLPSGNARAGLFDKMIHALTGDNHPSAQTENTNDKLLLHTAVRQGDIQKVKKYIAQGYDINARSDANDTPLHYAVQFGYREIAEILVTNGADVNATNGNGFIPTLLAVINNHNDIAEMLISHGAQKTIFLASAMGDVESVDAFLKKNPELANAVAANDGWSALQWAAHQERNNVIKLLIEKGAKVDIRDKNNGVTPLYWAARKGHIDTAKILIENGDDVNIKIKGGGTILHYAGSLEIAGLLVNNGAEVNAKDDGGFTPLHMMASSSPGIIQRVLFWKSGGTTRTWETDLEKYRGTAEKIAADIAELLIKNNADINAKNKDGHTPLSLAKASKNEPLIRLLEKYNAKDKY
jgi:ankyrin repeat protein